IYKMLSIRFSLFVSRDLFLVRARASLAPTILESAKSHNVGGGSLAGTRPKKSEQVLACPDEINKYLCFLFLDFDMYVDIRPAVCILCGLGYIQGAVFTVGRKEVQQRTRS